MLTITDYQRNANQNIREMQINTTSHQSEWPSLVSPQVTNAGEGVEKREPSYTVGGNVSWYNHYGEQYGGTLKNCTQNYRMTQKSHSWACIQTKLSLKKAHAPVYSQFSMENFCWFILSPFVQQFLLPTYILIFNDGLILLIQGVYLFFSLQFSRPVLSTLSLKCRVNVSIYSGECEWENYRQSGYPCNVQGREILHLKMDLFTVFSF